MLSKTKFGYGGKLLRIDLSENSIEVVEVEEKLARQFVGGTGFGCKFLYEAVPTKAKWDDKDNLITICSGPLGGTELSGTGSVSIVSKGPMTEVAGTTQANGYFGAYLKSCGFDGILIKGIAEFPVVLRITEGKAEILDGGKYWGLDTLVAEERIRSDLVQGKPSSVLGIGPAGERGVRFSVILGDGGHVASKNGMGAVLGAKMLKAIIVAKGKIKTNVHDVNSLRLLSPQLLRKAKEWLGGTIHNWGTGGLVASHHKAGILPVKNLTTNIFPAVDLFNGNVLRRKMELKPKRCWGCRLGHLHSVKVLDGPYAGLQAEEPEYESFAAFGSLIGIEDLGTMVMLADLVDRLGLDVNETGWIIAWVIECCEKGLLTSQDVDGLNLTWGSSESVRQLIYKISNKEGFGASLANGLMRIAEEIGGDAAKCAVYTKKGTTPRGHDHRARWAEMMDNCFSSTSTLEATAQGGARPELFGYDSIRDPFNPIEAAEVNVKLTGYRLFEDSLGVCNFNFVDPQLTVECVNAVTGWDLDLSEAMKLGLGFVQRLRMFNLRHGLDIGREVPSHRYSSTPCDGPISGIGIASHWGTIRESYYRGMGWDLQTGWPLRETLMSVGVSDLIEDLPGSSGS